MCVCLCVFLAYELCMSCPQKSALPVVWHRAVCSICVTVCSICVTMSCGECALLCSLCRFELLAPSPWGTPNGPRPLFIHLAGTGDHVSSVCCVVMRPCVCVCVCLCVFLVCELCMSCPQKSALPVVWHRAVCSICSLLPLLL